jgi:hypothetical protein
MKNQILKLKPEPWKTKSENLNLKPYEKPNLKPFI